jgi:hypothetical protein
MTNFDALRLVSSQVLRVPDPVRGRAIAVAALLAFTADTERERADALGAARRLLREALPPEDCTAAA